MLLAIVLSSCHSMVCSDNVSSAVGFNEMDHNTTCDKLKLIGERLDERNST